jgi:hypothetical protein
MFIDPWSCHHVDSLVDACGVEVESRGAVASRSPYFWDITDETTQFASRRRTSTPGPWHFGSWAPEEMPLVPAVPAQEAENEDQSVSSEGSAQMSIDSGSDDSIINMVTTSAHDMVEQAIVEAQEDQPTENEEDPGIDLFATPYSPPGGATALPPSLPSAVPTIPHGEPQSDEDDDASTSEDDMADVHFDQSKKPYCAFITSKYHKEHSDEASYDQCTRNRIRV